MLAWLLLSSMFHSLKVIWVEALYVFRPLLFCLYNGDTLGFQGSDILPCGGGEVVVAIASYFIEINVLKAWVIFLILHDSTHHLVTDGFRLEVGVMHIQVLKVCHGSNGVAEELDVALCVFKEPALVVAASEVGDRGQTVAASKRRQQHSAHSL